jgi:MscS family membrane protein
MSVVAQEASVRELVEKEEQSEQLLEAKAAELMDDASEASTPLSMLVNLSRAMESGDYEAATSFLDLRYLPADVENQDPIKLLKQLSTVWRLQKVLDLTSLSDSPEGHLDDGLPSYRDKLGDIRSETGTIPIYLQRIPDGKGGFEWKISNATIARIPELWKEFGYSELTASIADALPDYTFLGLYNWQVLYILIYLVISWPVIRIIVGIIRRQISERSGGYRKPLLKLFNMPLRLFLFLAPIQPLVLSLNVPIKSRIILGSGGLTYLAFGFLIVGIIDLIIAQQARSMESQDKGYIVPLLRPIGLMIKILVWLTLVLIWADNAGYDMTTVVAGLGIGSIAVALAAQKTLENIIGAITLYVARPVKPGDFCRFGTTLGTVEEMGLRSTSIRTLDGSMLHIPNGVFSSGEVENISVRKQIRFFRLVRLRLDTSPDQTRYILAELRRIFLSHPKVDQQTVSIRFYQISDDAIVIRLDVRIQTTDFQEYLEVGEDLNLRIVDTVKSSGSWFAVPTQSVRWEESNEVDTEKASSAKLLVEDWRQNSELPFPDFSEEELKQMKGKLDYPPSGSTGSR